MKRKDNRKKVKAKKAVKVNKPSTGKIKNATKITIDGILFKSKLEAFTYNELKKAGIINFKYEEDVFTLLQPFVFNNDSIEYKSKKTDGEKVNIYGPIKREIRGITYNPDFTCIKEDKTGWIIEVKGFNNDVFPLKWKWFKDHLIKNSYNVTLYKPANQSNVLETIKQIKEKFYV